MPLVHWIAAHPEESIGLALLVLSLLNGLLKGPPATLVGGIVDRLAFVVRSNAKGTLSWPIVGRSVFAPDPPPPPPAEEGNVR